MIEKLAGVRIKQLREGRGLSQEQAAQQMGIARSYFASLESGSHSFTMGKLEVIVRFFGITFAQFFDSPLFAGVTPAAVFEELNSPTGADYAPPTPRVRLGANSQPGFAFVPLVGTISAGTPLESIQAHDAYPVPLALVHAHPHAFLLTVTGESMNRILPDGSLVLIDPATNITSPDGLYALMVGDTEATVKYVHRAHGIITLLPDSFDPAFEPIVFSPDDDVGSVRIVGRVVAYCQPVSWVKV